MKILELFSGYGTATFALKALGIKYELVGYSDIDKYANQCFKQNHCPGDIDDKLRLGDATMIDPHELEDFDLLTGGFPCQAFSVAGKGLGELDTRGTLFNEIIRIAEVKQPRYMLLENVKGLTFKKHKPTFDKILSELDRIGYYVKWQVLNTKEHGIPQNRERVFFVCFSDFLDYNHFDFPNKQELKIFLKDILEEEVDEKYYLKQKQVDKLLNTNVSSFRSRNFIKNKVCQTLQSAMSHGNTIPLIFDVYNGKIKRDGICITLTEPHHNNLRLIQPLYISSTQKHNTVRDDGISNCLPSAMGMGGGHTPMVTRLKEKTRDVEKAIILANDLSIENNKPIQLDLYHLKSGQIRPLSTYIPQNFNIHRCIQAGEPKELLVDNFRIRKLTSKECFRLQGFLNDEVNLEGLSNTQRYKLAGNGQSVNVVKKIFKEIFK